MPVATWAGTWVSTNGPEGAEVRVVISDGAGGLLAGTHHGVFHRPADGLVWQPLGTGIQSYGVADLVWRGSTLVAATGYGVYELSSDGTWTSLGFPGGGATALVLDAVGRLVVGGYGFVHRLDGEEWTNLAAGLPAGNFVVGALLLQNGVVTIGTNGGVYRLPGDTPPWVPLGTGMPGNVYVVDLVEDGHGALYAGTYDYVWRLDVGSSTWTQISTGLISNLAFLAADPVSGVVFASTYNQVSTVPMGGTSWTPLVTLEGPQFIYSLLREDDGTLWAGTEQGVAALTPPTSHMEVAGLNLAYIYALGIDGSGGVVAGTKRGISRAVDGRLWTPLGSGLPAEPVRAIAQKDGTLFAGSLSVYELAPGETTWMPTNYFYYPQSLAFMSTGELVAGRYGHVDVRKGTEWSELGSGLPDGWAIDALIAHGGTLVAGTGTGPFRLDPPTQTWLPLGTGLSQGALWTRGFALDAGGALVAATINGVWRLDPFTSVWSQLASGTGPSLAYAVILESGTGAIIAAASNGVYRLPVGGVAWNRLGQPVESLVLAIDGAGRLFTGTISQAVLRLDATCGDGAIDTGEQCEVGMGPACGAGTPNCVGCSCTKPCAGGITSLSLSLQAGSTCGGFSLTPPPSAPFAGSVRGSGNQKLADLGSGCVYLGHDTVAFPPLLAAERGTSLLDAACTSGTQIVLGAGTGTGAVDCTLGPLETKHCLDTGNACTSGDDCLDGAACQPDAQCYFGPPVPIANGPLSTCFVYALRDGASGTGDTVSGRIDLRLPLDARLYTSGDEATPCPICSGGVCSDGARAGLACVDPGSRHTTHECPPNPGDYLISLSLPDGPLTTEPLVTGADADGFFCQAQPAAGAFGLDGALALQQAGSRAIGGLSTSPRSVSLVGSGCVGTTGIPSLDAALALPGPIAMNLLGSAKLVAPTTTTTSTTNPSTTSTSTTSSMPPSSMPTSSTAVVPTTSTSSTSEKATTTTTAVTPTTTPTTTVATSSTTVTTAAQTTSTTSATSSTSAVESTSSTSTSTVTSTTAPRCGNGILDTGEACDLALSDPRCCNACVSVRTGLQCELPEALGLCHDGSTCNGSAICEPRAKLEGEPCRGPGALGECDTGDVCDGTSLECPLTGDGAGCDATVDQLKKAAKVTCEADKLNDVANRDTACEAEGLSDTDGAGLANAITASTYMDAVSKPLKGKRKATRRKRTVKLKLNAAGRAAFRNSDVLVIRVRVTVRNGPRGVKSLDHILRFVH